MCSEVTGVFYKHPEAHFAIGYVNLVFSPIPLLDSELLTQQDVDNEVIRLREKKYPNGELVQPKLEFLCAVHGDEEKISRLIVQPVLHPPLKTPLGAISSAIDEWKRS